MDIKTITFLIISGLALPALACAQAAPCKGYRRGDPNCAVKAPVPPPPPPPLPGSPGATGSAVAAGAGNVVPKGLAYDLALTRAGSGDVIEFEPMEVAWTLKVAAFGISGADPEPVAVDICPAVMPPPPDDQAACAHLQRAEPGRSYHGKLSVPAPAAGIQSPLRLVVLRDAATSGGNNGQREAVAEQSIAVDAAARYDIALTGFEVVTTRSTSTDTVWISLQGQVKSEPPHPSDSDKGCHIAGFAWCITNQWYGDAGDGSHEVKDVRVGPFTLVPERQSDLRFLFYLDNHGTSIAEEIGLGVANAFSKAGMLALGAYGLASGSSGAGGFATQLDSAMEQLHSAEFASCDGKLADGIVIISNKSIDNLPQFTLDAFTRANGEFSATLPEIFRNKDGDFRCDRRGGAYKVSYAIYRTSWRDWGFKAAF